MPEHGSKIGWTHIPGYRGESWNPVTGCTKASPGCANCYAERMFRERFKQGFDVQTHPDRLDKPLHWREPRAIFVVSMGDLFHDGVPFEFIDRVVDVARQTERHVYLSCTKRAPRMEHYWRTRECPANWWQGVTVENAANRLRLDHLSDARVSHRFVSFEPLLSKLDLGMYLPIYADTYDDGYRSYHHNGDDVSAFEWALIGGESGDDPRVVDVDAYADVVAQCDAAGVPCFVKQDSGPRPGMQGRLPDWLWSIKEFPGEFTAAVAWKRIVADEAARLCLECRNGSARWWDGRSGRWRHGARALRPMPCSASHLFPPPASDPQGVLL